MPISAKQTFLMDIKHVQEGSPIQEDRYCMIAYTKRTGQASSLSCAGDRGWGRWSYGLRLWMEVRRDKRVLKVGGDRLYTAWWLHIHK